MKKGQEVFYAEFWPNHNRFIDIAYVKIEEIYSDGSMQFKSYNETGKEMHTFTLSKTEVKDKVRSSFEGFLNLIDGIKVKEEERIKNEYQSEIEELQSAYKDIWKEIEVDFPRIIKGTKRAKKI